MLKIFISSVFGEPSIQKMRDIIHKLVLPQLNEVASNQICRAIIQISQKSLISRRAKVIQKLLDKYAPLKMQSPESTTFEKIAAIFSEIRVALNFLPEEDTSKLNAFIFALDLQATYTYNFHVQNFDELKSVISYETRKALRKALIVLYEAHLRGKNPPHWLTD